MDWVMDYLGRDDLHCWGLVRQVFKEQAGIDLPEYGEVDSKQLHDVSYAVEQESALLQVWRPVSIAEHRSLDVVVMRGWLPDASNKLRRGVVHTGVVPRPGSLLHTDLRDVVVCVPLNHVTVRNRIVGVYRHFSRCSA